MAQTTSDFTKAYSVFLARVWTDPSYESRVSSDPATALKDAGVDLKAGAKVSVTRPTGHPSLDEQIKLWEQGNQTGTYNFVVPDRPPQSLSSTSPQKILAAADSVSQDDTSYCCCCCPSCSCT